jgi:hypothetical protein
MSHKTYEILKEFITYHEIGDCPDFRVKSRILKSSDPLDENPYTLEADHRPSITGEASPYYKTFSTATLEEIMNDWNYYISLFDNGEAEKINRF